MVRRLGFLVVLSCSFLILSGIQPALLVFNPVTALAAPEDNRAVTAIAFSPDGTTLASGYGNGDIVLWSIPSRNKLVTIEAHHGAAVTGLQFSPTGSLLASAGRDSVVQIWNVPSGTELHALHGHGQPATGVAFSPDGTTLASSGEDTFVFLWNVEDGTLRDALTSHNDFVTSVAFSPDSSTVASSSANGQIKLWDAESARLVRDLLGHRGKVESIAFSPNGTELVSGGEDTIVRVWNVNTGEEKRALRGHELPVRDVAFRPDGQDIASVSDDSQVIVWNAATGQTRRASSEGADPITTIAYSPDGSMYAIGMHNGLIRVLNATNGQLITTLMHNALPKNETTGQDQELSAVSDDMSRTLAQVEPTGGPGGPILVIRSPSNPYGDYYAEILRTEGLNAFQTINIGDVSAATLAAYDIAILSQMTLTAGQVTTLTDWVNDGGNLIAMRPDKQLASLLGLADASGTVTEGYMQVNTSASPGTGITGETMQFHGVADRYNITSATSVATLYSDATTATSNPAVTMRSIGTGSGHAAAFTYDLARSVALTRQGNPAWDAQERDSFGPIRSNDLFFGAASFDPKPDWIDFNKVLIPQADEQQRLLANLIIHLNLESKPLPRFWYLPYGHKAVVVMTGDDHGNNGTSAQFDTYAALSPSGCSVEDWECLRATSYIYPNTPITDSQAAAYHAQGFEIGLHVSTFCQNYTAASLQSNFTDQLSDWASKYTSLPMPQTNRTHCIAWSDWSTQATVSLNHGIRLDTNYYFWPPGWVADRPGFFTGSGMPMRFVDLNGSMIDVYHAVTQITDESGQSQPFTINTLLDGALGPNGYYGVFTVNAHTDLDHSEVGEAVVDSALARGVPVISAQQLLTWLDGRNNSTFDSLTWNGTTLQFGVTPGSGARGLQTMLPRQSAGGVLTDLTRNGSPVQFSVIGMKGVEYAVFAAEAGSYVASYGSDTVPPTVTDTDPNANATEVSIGANVSATFSEAIDPATITTASFKVEDSGGNPFSAAVSFDATTQTAMLDPSGPLVSNTTYTVTILGGSSGVKDLAGNALTADVIWSFTTAAGPSCPCTIWPSTTTPATVTNNDPNAVELGVKFRADTDGFITGIRFYKGSQNTGTHTGSLWTLNGQLLAQAAFTNETASGWQQVLFSTPVAITANTVYVASYYTPTGFYSANGNYFGSSGFTREPLHALQNGVSGGNGVYSYSGSPTFPTQSFNAANYWVDVVFTTSGGSDTTPPTVTETNPTANATGVALDSNVTATFSENVDASTLTASTFTLKTSGGTLVPAAVTYNSTTHVATLDPNANLSANETYTATVVGGASGVKDSAGNALASDFAWSFTTVAPDTTPLTVTDTSPAADATDVAIDSNVTATFSEAIDQATLTTTTFALRDSGGTVVPAALTYNATTRVATLNPDANLAASATYTATVVGGSSGVKDTDGNALAADVTWSFTTAAADTADTTPPTVTATSPAANATGEAVDANVTATFSEAIDEATLTTSTFVLRTSGGTIVPAALTYNATTRVATLDPTADLAADATYTATVVGGASGVKDVAGNALAADVVWSFTTAGSSGGGGCPCTIWPDTATPAVASDSETAAVELGVKFRADTNGYITGIRFYKGSQNTGTHTGSLWTTGGQLLAQATFTNETASGWQTVTFGEPVAITANTVYVASYHAPNGRYSLNLNYFTSAVTSGPVQALQNGTSGGNGVYNYSGTPTFPTQTWNASNYWVDIVFMTSLAPDTTPPTVTETSPAANATDVAANANITATFSEAIDQATLTTTTFALRDSGGTLVPATITYNATTRVATLDPNATLTASETYTATVMGGASGVKDVAGNALAADFTWSFTTSGSPPDTTPPTVTATSPAANETDVAVNADVTATFSEAIDQATLTATTFVLRTSDGAAIPASLTYNATTQVATLNPTADLAGGSTYTATVVGGSSGVKDVAGNALAADVVWSFTTAGSSGGGGCPCSIWPDTATPATASKNDPAAVELGVKFRADTNGVITGIRFYKGSQNTGTHTGSLWTTGGQLLAQATFTNETATGWQQVLFSTPVAVTANTVYVASYHTTSGFYALNENFFTSAVTNGPLQALQNGTSGGNGVYNYGGSPTFPNQTWNASNYWVDVVFETGSGALVTLLASASTDAPMATFAAEGFTPLTGTFQVEDDTRSLAAVGDESIWADTTTPAVASKNDPSAVEVGVKFRATTSGYITGLRFYKGNLNTGTHTGSLWSSTGQLLARATFTAETATGWQQVSFSEPVAITANTVYVASYHTTSGRYAINENFFTSGVTSGSLQALANGESGGNGVYNYSGTPTFPTQSWNASNYWVDVVFNTSIGADTTPPTVTGASPAANATGVAVGSNVTATFSEPIDAATLTTSTFVLRTSGGTVVPAAVTYNATTRVATLDPNANLTASATYSVTVVGGSSGVKDVAGNALAADVTWSFTTAASDTTPPTVTSTSPAANATNVSAGANVTATFSEAIDQATLTTSTYILRDSEGMVVPAVLTYNTTTRVATLNPNADLTAGATYVATVVGGASGVKDLAGNALASNVAWSFTTASAGGPCAAPANEIIAENCKPGTPESIWDINGNGDTSIQGFATDMSVNKGDTIQFKVRTNASNYRLDIYRIGYYDGDGARFITSITPSATLPQAQPDCLTQSDTGLIDCGNWAVSASWATPADAVSGVYIARLVRADTNGASHIIFIVRDDNGQSDLLFQTADTTWQAYNDFGGNSLYRGNTSYSAGRAVKVSYNRPFYTRGNVVEDSFFNADYPMIRWLERNGYDVSYFSGIDSDRFGSEILEHQVFLSVAHDEYWSGNQRAHVEAARAAGVHLAFFSGNEVYWKTRWEPSIDGSNTSYRTLVTYKEGNAGELTCGLKCDPLPNVWTGLWRAGCEFTEADGCRPENALTGQISWHESNSPITVPEIDGKMRFWKDTSIANLSPGQTATLPTGVLGYEWDFEQPTYASFNPPGRITLSETTISGRTHKLSLYKHESGALVFGAGTGQWSWGLDSNHDRSGTPTDERMQQATVNLFADMGVQPGTLQSGLVPASASTDTTAPSSTITSPEDGATLSVGSTVTITGTATDGEGTIGAVEVSVDGGVSWRTANGRGSWSFTWTPSTNATVNIRSRAVDDSGNIETPSAGVTVTVGSGSDPGDGNCPCTIWSNTTTPALVTENDPSAVELGVKFQANSSGFITGIRFYKGPSNTGTHTGSLWTSGGQLLARATFAGETDSGWQQVTFSEPVAITANTVYVASYHTTSGFYSLDENYFVNGLTRGPLHALQSGVNGGNGVYFYSSSPTFPTQTWNASNYWVDVVFVTETGPDETPPTVTGTSPANNATGVAVGTNVTATFSEAIDQATLTTSTFVLRDSGGTVVPATLTYNATTRVATLDPTSNLAVNATYTATVVGGASGVKDVAGNALAADVTWSFTTAAADTTPPTVTSTSPAANATDVPVGTNVTATFSEPIDQATLTTSTFVLRTSGGTAVPATLTYNSTTRVATLDPTADLTANATYTATVTGGSSGVKDLAGNALAADFTWSFTTASGPGCPCTIWADTTTPAVESKNDSSAVELGVKFQSNTSGYITGIRFYKGSQNTGTHTGSLWTSSGQLLARATFTNETASGWQEVTFSEPVAITANTVYVASYHTTSGFYSINENYFTSGVTSGPLQALQSGVNGSNGVYSYGGAPVFPTQSWNASNYWVDVVFVTTIQ